MDAIEVLRDGFGRVAETLPRHLAGLDAELLLWQPKPEANSIGWLAWHIGRCEDAQVAAIAGEPDVYSQQGWVDRVDLPYRDHEIGYGHTPAQVREFRITDPALLTDYYAAVHEATLRLLADLTADDLDRLVDDPFQVSVGVRLVSVVNDVTQHLGQIGYLRGLIDA
ncbi:MAG: DinB family protein [Brooklawnia sp.]|uniref:mycothiol transferase n=1 Tax=Brooklawnia sp. TaxID=2699740 RepID=UPI003C7264A0